MSRKFKKIYYVVQLAPIITTASYCFSLKEAKKLSKIVSMIGNCPTTIVEFTRDELIELQLQK